MLPVWTESASVTIVRFMTGFDSCRPSTVSPRKSGNPESMSVASCRVKIIRTLLFTVFFWKSTIPPFLPFGAATALACLRRPLPAFHYMVAVAGGDSVPLVPYFTFGTEALSLAVGAALQDRLACLLANHGLVAAGSTVAHAMKVLQEVESLCQIYLQALAVGEPVLLSALDMATVLEKFRSYGRAARV